MRAQGHDPGQDERDGKGLPLGIQRLDFAEADGQGDDRHIQRVQQAPAGNHPVADHAVDRHAHQQQQREAEPDQQPVACRWPGQPPAATVKAAHAHAGMWSGQSPSASHHAASSDTDDPGAAAGGPLVHEVNLAD
jgi:hypothetical protein